MAKKRQIVRKSSYFLFVNIDFTLMKAFSWNKNGYNVKKRLYAYQCYSIIFIKYI
jgi:hypothetical protein